MKKKNFTIPEKNIQIQVVNYVRVVYPNLLFFQVRNEGKRSKREGAEAKKMGLMAGVSDLYFLHNGKSLFLELKREKGRQSKSQMEFQEKVILSGGEYVVANSYDTAITAIQDFVKKNN